MGSNMDQNVAPLRAYSTPPLGPSAWSNTLTENTKRRRFAIPSGNGLAT